MSAPPLRVLTWPDYALPGLERLAREALGVEVEWHLFDQNEEAFQRVVGAPAAYDVVFADGTWPRLHLERGLVRPLEVSALQRFDQLEPVFRERCGELWEAGDGEIAAYPAYWGLRGLLVDPAACGAVDSWRALFDAPRGTAWVNSQGSEIVAEIALGLGHPADEVYALDADALGRVSRELGELCSGLGGVWRLLPELEDAFREGATVAEVHSTSLLHNVARACGRELTAVLPREGTVGWIDGAMVMAASVRAAEATAFIELMLSPEGVLTQWEESDGYWSTSAEAMRLIRADARFAEKASLAAASVDAFLDCALYQPPADPSAYLRAWSGALARAARVPASVRSAVAELAI
jgi:spermidine/putrescine transport system substrate-binding protein